MMWPVRFQFHCGVHISSASCRHQQASLLEPPGDKPGDREMEGGGGRWGGGEGRTPVGSVSGGTADADRLLSSGTPGEGYQPHHLARNCFVIANW